MVHVAKDLGQVGNSVVQFSEFILKVCRMFSRLDQVGGSSAFVGFHERENLTHKEKRQGTGDSQLSQLKISHYGPVALKVRFPDESTRTYRLPLEGSSVELGRVSVYEADRPEGARILIVSDPSEAMGPVVDPSENTESHAEFAPFLIFRVSALEVESSHGCHASGEEGALDE